MVYVCTIYTIIIKLPEAVSLDARGNLQNYCSVSENGFTNRKATLSIISVMSYFYSEKTYYNNNNHNNNIIFFFHSNI